MKRIISMLLALVMVLGLAVTSYAGTIVLQPVKDVVVEPIVLESLPLSDVNESIFTAGEGGTYYIMLDPAINYKNITVTASGAVSARMVDYDAKTFAPIPGITYKVVRLANETVEGATGMTYEDAVAKADELNKANKTAQYVVKPEAYANIIEVVIEDNYSASYKEGKLVVKALNAGTNKNETATLTVVRDVVIFGYENVKYYADKEQALDPEYITGYSDYETAQTGYKDYVNVMYCDYPTVICTTAFRTIEGKDIAVDVAGMTVTIKDVAKGQKGVNFAAYGVKEVDTNKDGDAEEVVFGFHGKQAINSKFEIVFDTGYTWFTLREAFGIKLEEDDVLVYTLYKDGQPYASFEVDYADVEEAYSPVKLVIDGAAGTTLGEYSIQVGEAEFPAEEVEDEVVEEANPNTGAPSFFEWIWMLIFS